MRLLASFCLHRTVKPNLGIISIERDRAGDLNTARRPLGWVRPLLRAEHIINPR